MIKKVDIKCTVMMDDFFILYAIWHVPKPLTKVKDGLRATISFGF